MVRACGRVALAALGAPLAIGVLIALAGGCSGAATRARDIAGDRRPRSDDPDAAAGGPNVPEPPGVLAKPTVVGKKPRLIARASSRAIALDATHIYYGDSEDDALYAIPKAGGTAVHLARHAPVAGAIALDGEFLTWIASPGDAVHKVSVKGGQPTTLRDRGIFSDVGAAGGDIFITEAIGAGGALLRVTGSTAVRLAAFDGPPRAVMTDATHVYVITPTKIFRTPHLKGEFQTIATGTNFNYPEIDDAFVYALADVDRAHVVVRFPKAGGPMTTIARDVRDVAAELAGKEFLYIDATRPQLRSVPIGGGESHVVSEDESFSGVTAVESDAATIYVAAGARESGVILAIDR